MCSNVKCLTNFGARDCSDDLLSAKFICRESGLWVAHFSISHEQSRILTFCCLIGIEAVMSQQGVILLGHSTLSTNNYASKCNSKLN